MSAERAHRVGPSLSGDSGCGGLRQSGGTSRRTAPRGWGGPGCWCPASTVMTSCALLAARDASTTRATHVQAPTVTMRMW